MAEIIIYANIIVDFFILIRIYKFIKVQSLISLYAFFLLAYLILGYDYLAIYTYFSLGNMPDEYFKIFSDNTYIISFLFHMFLYLIIFYLSKINLKNNSILIKSTNLIYHIGIVIFFVFIYFLAVKFKTLAIGAVEYSLPLRLNGLVEVICLYIIPFYISILLKDYIPIVFIIVLLYALANLVLFGSKYAALIPFITSFYTLFILGKYKIKIITLVIVLILSMFTIINPYYFRNNEESNIFISIYLSYLSAHSDNYNFLNTMLDGLRNFSGRIIGIVPLEWSVDIMNQQTNTLNPNFSVNNYINRQYFGITSSGFSLASGIFAFFIIASGSLVIGVFSTFTFFIFLNIAIIYFSKNMKGRYKLTGPVFFATMFPFIIDGNFDSISLYLHSIISFILAYIILRYLFRECT